MKARPDFSRCDDVGRVLSGLRLRKDFYRRDFLTIKANPESKAMAYILSVAICHQTHGLRNSRLNLVGWDYMEHEFLRLMREGSPLLDARTLSGLSPEEVSSELRVMFSESRKPDGCTLNNIEERAGFMVETARFIAKGYGSALGMIKSSGGFLLNNGSGLYEILERTVAYSDPMRKKSTFLLKFLDESGLFHPKDPGNIVPVMDYHIQRVLLRMGCVKVMDNRLVESLRSREPVEPGEEAAVRMACIEAMRRISHTSRYPIILMNDFFWPLGRSCCRKTTLCTSGKCEKEPCTFQLLVDMESHNKCPFEAVCLGRKDGKARSLWEPEIRTHYY